MKSIQIIDNKPSYFSQSKNDWLPLEAMNINHLLRTAELVCCQDDNEAIHMVFNELRARPRTLAEVTAINAAYVKKHPNPVAEEIAESIELDAHIEAITGKTNPELAKRIKQLIQLA